MSHIKRRNKCWKSCDLGKARQRPCEAICDEDGGFILPDKVAQEIINELSEVSIKIKSIPSPKCSREAN